MAQRIDSADRVAALSVLVGALSLFLSWYSYSTATTRVAVNGFRASILGEVFFVALAAMALLLLVRTGAIDERPPTSEHERVIVMAIAIAAGGSVFLQLILDIIAGGRAIGPGLLLAVLAAVGLGACTWLRVREYTPAFIGRRRHEEGLPD
jgi:hypothetical protein